MAQTSWPFENVDTSETQFSQWARNIGEGVKGSSSGTELKPYGDSSGMQVMVPAGQAMVRGHYYNSTATETLAISAAHATLARIDSVVLELDPSSNSILLKVLTGTPNASPAAPTLTQTDSGIYQFLLGTVSVAAAATTIAAGNVTDSRTFLGEPVRPNFYTINSSTLTLTSAYAGNVIRGNLSTGITVTVPANVFKEGDRIDFIQQAASGDITFTAGAGLTLYSKSSLTKLSTRYAAASVIFYTPSVAYLIGELA